MTALVTTAHWSTTRRSLEQATERFAELLSATSDSGVRATTDWSIADTAAHVATIARLAGSYVRTDDSPAPFSGIDRDLRTATVDDVAGLNTEMLRQFPERDPRVVAELLRGDVADILRATEAADPAAPVDWLGGARIPTAGVLAHLLNEVLLHGRDIARATRADWSIPPRDIGLFFDLFLIGMMRHGTGHLLDSTERPPKRRVAVEFRSRYSAPATIVLQDHRVFIEEPGGETDVRLSFHPPTLSLMLFGRIGKVRAMLSGGVAVRGRRPWLLPVFMRTVRLPAPATPNTGKDA